MCQDALGLSAWRQKDLSLVPLTEIRFRRRVDRDCHFSIGSFQDIAHRRAQHCGFNVAGIGGLHRSHKASKPALFVDRLVRHFLSIFNISHKYAYFLQILIFLSSSIGDKK
jgi:hypothetical protein